VVFPSITGNEAAGLMQALRLYQARCIHSGFGGRMTTDDLRAFHVGIVAGTSEGAALCYRTLCRKADEAIEHNMHPEITLHAFPLRLYLDAIDLNDWASVAALMSHSAAKLVRAGADVIVCPNNTLHKAFDLVESSVPWLHIAEPVVKEIARREWRRVGILGTQIVMEGSIYSLRLKQSGINAVIPRKDDRVLIQHIIRAELIAGLFTAQSRRFLQKVIAEMAADGGGDSRLHRTPSASLRGTGGSSAAGLDQLVGAGRAGPSSGATAGFVDSTRGSRSMDPRANRVGGC
jgi:aspartate racemase